MHIKTWLRAGYFTSSNFLALYCSAPFRKLSSMMSHSTVPYVIIIMIIIIIIIITSKPLQPPKCHLSPPLGPQLHFHLVSVHFFWYLRPIKIKSLTWLNFWWSPVQDHFLGHVQTSSSTAAIFRLFSSCLFLNTEHWFPH